MRASAVLLLLGACTWPTSDDDRFVSGTIVLMNEEPGAALAQAGPFVSVIDRVAITVTDATGLVIASVTIPLQRYDSTASTTIELPEGLATFTAEVRSNNGALLYTGTTTATVQEGFTVDIRVVAQRPVLVVQPDTLKTTGQPSGVFTLHNAGSQALVWNLSSIDPRLCNEGCRVTPQLGSILPHQNVTFRADIPQSTPTGVFLFTVSSAEGDVPVRWAHTRPAITNVTVTPAPALVAVQQQVTMTATVQPAFGGVFWSTSSFTVASVSGGVVLGRGSGTATISAASEVDPSISGLATARVYGSFTQSFPISTPVANAPDTVTRDGIVDAVATLRATYFAATTPFSFVEFWGRSSGTAPGRWILLTQSSTPARVDNDGAITWVYTTVWNPTATTAPYTNPSVTRLDLIAIGVTPSGAVTASPINNHLWVRIP